MAPTGWLSQEQHDFLFSHMTKYLNAQRAGRLSSFLPTLFLTFFAKFPNVPSVPPKPLKDPPQLATGPEIPDGRTEVQIREDEARVAHGRVLQACQEVSFHILASESY